MARVPPNLKDGAASAVQTAPAEMKAGDRPARGATKIVRNAEHVAMEASTKPKEARRKAVKPAALVATLYAAKLEKYRRPMRTRSRRKRLRRKPQNLMF